MPGAAGLAPGDHLAGAVEVAGTRVRGAWCRSWSRYLRFSAEQLITPPSLVVLGEPLTDRLEPGVAVVVVERVAGGHLGDVGRRVEVVGVGERHPEPLGEGGAHGGLPRSRDPHDHDERWWHGSPRRLET